MNFTEETILLIDWGNTYIKCLLLSQPFDVDAQSNNVVNMNSVDELEKIILTEKQTINLNKAYISSVRKSSENDKLKSLLEKLSIEIQFAKTSNSFANILCAYKEFKSFGIDRWMAIIAGYDGTKSTAIIDLGSAITFDIVESNGSHIGGQIVPGKKLLLESLRSTDRVIVSNENLESNQSQVGSSTNECVRLGIEQMIKGYLISIIGDSKYKHQIERWVFTGGGGKYWMRNLISDKTNNQIIKDNSFYEPALIFKGLVKYFKLV